MATECRYKEWRRRPMRIPTWLLFVLELASPCTPFLHSSTANYPLKYPVFLSATQAEWQEKVIGPNFEPFKVQSSSDPDASSLEEKRKQAAKRAALLAKQKASRSSSGRSRDTSVGSRRIGSATKARQGGSKVSKLSDALRKKAQGTGAAPIERPQSEEEDNGSPSLRVSQSVIQTAIDDMLRDVPGNVAWDETNLNGVFHNFGRTIGILGEAVEQMSAPPQMVHPTQVLPRPIVTSLDQVAIRLATPRDDVDIANLRLSVFSGFSPELQSQFCQRSCQAIANRRKRGAVCVIAGLQTDNNREMILGSAECSFHEFALTRLGRRRRKDSILYVTEVAVNPAARRRGIGQRLMRAVDNLARQRNIETLYLHVDVTNGPALTLYAKSGYTKVRSDDPMYVEFTKSLNLHPGATKGREHFLLYKNLTSEPVWIEDTTAERVPSLSVDLVGALGFEIPA